MSDSGICKACQQILGDDIRNIPYGFRWLGWDIITKTGIQHALASPCPLSMLATMPLCQIDKRHKEMAREAKRLENARKYDIAEAVAAEREACAVIAEEYPAF